MDTVECPGPVLQDSFTAVYIVHGLSFRESFILFA
jgi:hypothetical protein